MFGLKSASYWTQSAATAANWDNHMKTRQELEYFSENESPQTFELKYALSTSWGVFKLWIQHDSKGSQSYNQQTVIEDSNLYHFKEIGLPTFQDQLENAIARIER